MTLKDIETEVRRIAARIGASEDQLPTFGMPEDSGRPHVEVEGERLHFVHRERGHEASRATTHDVDELLFWVFSSITFGLAADYELAHRVHGQDFRRLLFARQEELLGQLSPDWALREAEEHTGILKRAPYDDLAGARAELSVALREQGHSPEEAWRLACERMPLPNA